MESQYNQMEKLLLRIFENQKLPDLKRFEAGVNVFQIDNFYKAKTKVEDVLEQILALKPDEAAELSQEFVSKSMVNLANKFFASIQMKQSLKNLDFMANMGDIDQFQKYANLYILAWEQISQHTDDIEKHILEK